MRNYEHQLITDQANITICFCN